ncbi:hypothetical protein LCGC14_1394130 [marine sediment metagenome]|uniref:Uncharacterized protein n=1 Tax=marine sediment metagenome TaxID=412755 RepID=A0A0F9JZ31_9ZZZZ
MKQTKGINLLDLFHKIDAVSKNYSVYGAFQPPYIRINSENINKGVN